MQAVARAVVDGAAIAVVVVARAGAAIPHIAVAIAMAIANAVDMTVSIARAGRITQAAAVSIAQAIVDAIAVPIADDAVASRASINMVRSRRRVGSGRHCSRRCCSRPGCCFRFFFQIVLASNAKA